MTKNKRMRNSGNRAIPNEKEEEEAGEEDRISSLPNSLLLHILSFLDDTKETVRTCVLSKRWKVVWTELLDRISSLPDPLLLHILSFLKNTKEIVKTCVLSKRWEFVWNDMLEFNLRQIDMDDDKELRRSVERVGRIISMCKSLNKFSITLRYIDRLASTVNHWLYFAIRNKVKDITLDLCYRDEYDYDLPQMLYSYSSLSKLSVSQCVMAPLVTIRWRSLESLKIQHVELSDSVMDNILSNCPLLKILYIWNCDGFNHLNFKSPNLTTLEYVDEGYGDDVPDISAPYLRVLSIYSEAGGSQYKLTNLSSVVQATIVIHNPNSPRLMNIGTASRMNHMKELLQSLQSVEILELGPEYLMIVSVLEVKKWIPPFYTKLWSLTLEIYNHEMSILGILAILRSSPNLETLVIKGHDTKEMDIDQREICVKDCSMDLVAYHLNTVEIKYLEAEHMLTLVQILLKCAKVLEKMFIRTSSDHSMEIANKLITFPRTSPNAVVLLDEF